MEDLRITKKEFIKMLIKIPVTAGLCAGALTLIFNRTEYDKSKHSCGNRKGVCSMCHALEDCLHPTAQSYIKNKDCFDSK